MPFQAICPARCPPGMVCVTEVGGVARGGGQYCAPIPTACGATPSCDCMASCVCTNIVGGRPEACTFRNNAIYCDNGLR
jgi:hypothetical protein